MVWFLPRGQANGLIPIVLFGRTGQDLKEILTRPTAAVRAKKLKFDVTADLRIVKGTKRLRGTREKVLSLRGLPNRFARASKGCLPLHLDQFFRIDILCLLVFCVKYFDEHLSNLIYFV